MGIVQQQGSESRLCSGPSSARNKDQKLVGRFLKKGYFIGCYTAVPLKGNLADQSTFWLAKC